MGRSFLFELLSLLDFLLGLLFIHFLRVPILRHFCSQLLIQGLDIHTGPFVCFFVLLCFLQTHFDLYLFLALSFYIHLVIFFLNH